MSRTHLTPYTYYNSINYIVYASFSIPVTVVITGNLYFFISSPFAPILPTLLPSGSHGSTYLSQDKNQSSANRFSQSNCIISVNVIFHRPSELFDNVESTLLKNFPSKINHRQEPSHASHRGIPSLMALIAL